MNTTEIPLSLTSKREERPLMVMDMADGGGQHASISGDARPRRLTRWTDEAHLQLLSFHKGYVVKPMGNGLMMEFADARSCLQAAFALGQLAESLGPQADASKRLRLRAGAHLANYSQSQGGIVGPDVKLTSELTALAQPGEVLVTAELRDRLTDGLDADFEDLGYQRVKPSPQPVRLFRAHPAQSVSDWSTFAHRDLRPGLAIIPFKAGIPETKQWMVGELIAEGVIARLSHSIAFRVISRQSTSVLRDSKGFSEIQHHLGATYVLSGSYSIQGKRLTVNAELAEVRSHTLVWSGQLQRSVDDLLRPQSHLLHELAHQVAQTLGNNAHVRKVLTQPLPRLDSSFLMLAGISMTHSHSAKTFERGREVLTELTVRHPELALPRAWLGMWHALSVVKGQSDDVALDTARAREQTLRALEAESHNAMALAVEGYIHCQLLGDPHEARKYLNSAIDANPSEPMAWLFRSLYSSMWDSGPMAVIEAYFARALSPVDPLRYFFDLLTANALLADRQHEQTIACAHKSLRASKRHVPTLRILLTAQAELGHIEEGKETLGKLLAEVPGLTVSSYLAMGSADSSIRQRIAAAMRQLGLPETCFLHPCSEFANACVAVQSNGHQFEISSISRIKLALAVDAPSHRPLLHMHRRSPVLPTLFIR